MSRLRTHYGITHQPAKMNEWAECAAKLVDQIAIGRGQCPLLAYRGMSGTAMATALGLALQRLGRHVGFCYVRKDHEIAHGDTQAELCIEGRAYFPVFVDDGIYSGETKRKTQAGVRIAIHEQHAGKVPTGASVTLNAWVFCLQNGWTDSDDEAKGCNTISAYPGLSVEDVDTGCDDGEKP